MDTFSPSDLCLYKCKESSVHGTISSVLFQNIISSVLLLYCGHISPDLRLYKFKEFSVHGTISYVVFQNISITAVLEIRSPPRLLPVCVCVCVFFPFILDIKFVGRTSRGHTGGRSHRIFHPPSFCGACLHFSREKDSAIPFPRRP